MAKQFFTGWQGWEKLVFILACAIVVTIFLGSMKLAYTHWRLRKLGVAAEREKQEQALYRMTNQQAKDQQGPGVDDVPFGIRAIESGTEIEGVWISRSNTPEPTSRATSKASSIWEHVACGNSSVDSENHKWHGGDGIASNSSRETPRPVVASSDRAVLSDEEFAVWVPTDSAARLSFVKPPRNRHPPSSYVRFSCNPYLLRQSTVASTLEGLEAIHNASTSFHGQAGDGSSSGDSRLSSNSTTDPEPISAAAPRLLTGSIVPQAKHEFSSDLNLLNSHRISQVAETGQLTPRARTSGQSQRDNLATAASSGRSSTEQNGFFSAQLGSSYVQNAATPSVTHFPSPKMAALPLAVRRSSMPDAVPFAQFCQIAPPSPRSDGYRPGPTIKSTTSMDRQSAETSQDRISLYVSSENSPDLAMPVSEGVPELTLPPPLRTSFEKQPRNILRGHGTGFEILKPGSLVPQMRLDQRRQSENRGEGSPAFMAKAFSQGSFSIDGRRKLRRKRALSS